MSLSPKKTRLLTMAHVEFVKKNARSLPEPEKWPREKRPKGAEQESQHQLPKFNSEFSPEKLPKPNRKGDRLPTNIFQGRTVKLRGCMGISLVLNGKLTTYPKVLASHPPFLRPLWKPVKSLIRFIQTMGSSWIFFSESPEIRWKI